MIQNFALVTLSFCTMFLAAPVWAQDTDSDKAKSVDEIIARGTIQTDPAMSAWHAGDYATAEIEFDKNAFCALRAERLFFAGVESARDSSITANIAADSVGPSLGAGGQGGVAAPPNNSSTLAPQFNSSPFGNNESATKRTCEDRGFQLYMRGLSQLKLGKMAEAKKSLSRAANMRKNLYDAHFRLGLMEYQDGNLKEAQKQLKKLKKLKTKYSEGEASKEINAQISYLTKLVG